MAFSNGFFLIWLKSSRLSSVICLYISTPSVYVLYFGAVYVCFFIGKKTPLAGARGACFFEPLLPILTIIILVWNEDDGSCLPTDKQEKIFHTIYTIKQPFSQYNKNFKDKKRKWSSVETRDTFVLWLQLCLERQ